MPERIFEQKPSLEELAHHGVKGMHWGVRKANDVDVKAAPSLANKGVIARADGSIEISKGANLQRLVRSNGHSLPMKDLTYASINDYDNSRYIKSIGGKGFLGGGRDTILSIQATKTIKAPSVDEATKIVSNLLVNDAKFRKSVDVFGTTLNDRPKELARIKKDPGGSDARAWYESANTALTFSKEFDPNAPYVQKTIREEFAKKGYNAVRDENDFGSKLSKAPIIIFNPESSLRVVKSTMITDEIRKA